MLHDAAVAAIVSYSQIVAIQVIRVIATTAHAIHKAHAIIQHCQR